MTYRDYICDNCGYSSEEKRGVYYCPECGSKMRIAKVSPYGGDTTTGYAKWLIYLIVCIIGYPFCFATFGFILGTIIFIVLFILVRMYLNRQVRDNAIKKK